MVISSRKVISRSFGQQRCICEKACRHCVKKEVSEMIASNSQEALFFTQEVINPMRLVLLFIACLVGAGVASAIIGVITGFMPGIFPILIVAALLTAAVNNRLESRRIKKELQREGLE